MSLTTMTGAVLLAAAALLIAQSPSEARPGREAGMVTACSLYGKGCVTAPTRRGRIEQEVRLPGGVWIGCKRDCRQTLREESVDFFETLNERAPDWR